MASRRHGFLSPQAHVRCLPQAYTVGAFSREDFSLRAEQLLIEQPSGLMEVRVKNTFIHVEDVVEDVVETLPRSKSDSDLGSGSPWPSESHEGTTCMPRIASSSNVTATSVQAAQSRNEVVKEKDHSQAGEWTRGAAQHDAGYCKPCVHYNMGVCTAGSSCRFCHLPHRRRNRARPNKAKRAQAKAVVAMNGKHHQGSSAQLADEICWMSADCGANKVDLAYLRKVVASRAARIEEKS